MSLQTDIIFVAAIKSDTELLKQLAIGDVYNTTIAMPDEDADNAPLPYIIVAEGEVVNNGTTKDDYEGDTDSVNISITVAARNRNELVKLTNRVRKAVRRFFMNATEEDDYFDMVPLNYHFSAKKVMYDPLKPCHWRELNYQCDVNNDIMDDDD